MKSDAGITEKAGGIVVHTHEGNLFVLLVFRHNHNDWTFPKGSIEVNESRSGAAIREIREECGINVELITELPPLEYVNKRSGEQTKVCMYLFQGKDTQVKSEHAEDKVEWVKIEEVEEKLSYENLKVYFRNIKNKLATLGGRP